MKPTYAIVIALVSVPSIAGQEKKADTHREAIDKGLAWLAKNQRKDGSWCDYQNNMPGAYTAFAGMALLADGNTLSEGKYSANLCQAFAWFRDHQPKDATYNGLLGGDPNDPGTSGRYMPQHGIAMSFLAQLFEESNGDDRKTLQKLLSDGVAFSMKGQATIGGWFYTGAFEGHDSSENVTTMLVIQGLIDARNAGIAVPRQPMQKAFVSMQRSTTAQGGISYSDGRPGGPTPKGGGRPTINAMALAAYVPTLGYGNETTRRWLMFCAEQGNLLAPERLEKPTSSDPLLAHYYLSKAVYHLTADDWRAAFPDKKMPDHLNWVKYRSAMFDFLHRTQGKEGSWGRGHAWGMGPIYSTSLALNILLYEQTQRAPISR